MGTVGTRNLTLADIARRLDDNKQIDTIIEIINTFNPITDDMIVREANQGTTNKTTVRTGLPTPTWRKLYGGVQSSKSSTMQVVDSVGMLEALPKIDVDVVEKSGDPAGTLLSEHMPHLEAMAQEVESTVWYGDTDVYPDRFMGLSPRYSVLSTDNTKSGYNVFDAGGTNADNTSVWLLTWGDNTLHALVPKGSKAGLHFKKIPNQLVAADDGSGDFEAIVTKYKWDIGLTLRDWRSCGRICNIDVSSLEANSSAANLVKFMIRLSERLRGASGKRIWYMHERVRTMLRLQMLGSDGTNNTNVNLTFETVEGKKVMMFDGIQIHVSDKLLLTEARVV